MKFICTSDLHGSLPELHESSPDDIILIAGDIGVDFYLGKPEVLPWYRDVFAPWAAKIPGQIHMTWGNHDFIGERLPDLKWNDYLPPNVHVHVDQQVELGGKKIWFSPWTPTFGLWAFMEYDLRLVSRYDKIPLDTEIIVSHGPPYKLGDRTDSGTYAGSKSLRAACDRLPDLQAIVCGHIHEGFGVYKRERYTIYNVSYVDSSYAPVNPPVSIEVS